VCVCVGVCVCVCVFGVFARVILALLLKIFSMAAKIQNTEVVQFFLINRAERAP
jgi:hypothetical protein